MPVADLAQKAHASSASAWHRQVALALMVASGFAGLGYQIVWTQQCALWLGHESAAVLAVVAAFFGGLGLGALTLGRLAARSTHPARWYAGCELLIAAWSLAMALLLGPVSQWMLSLTGAQPSTLWQWGVAFVGSFVLLLPATAAMGATLPAMDRMVSSAFSGAPTESRFFAALYAGNTAGAVIGVLATALWLIPEWGLVRTAGVCALLNAFCAVAALFFDQRSRQSFQAASASIPARRASRSVLWLLAFTGWLGIGYEVLVVRVLSQVAEDTVYTFALLLAVYLVGTAIGAALYQRFEKASPDAEDGRGATTTQRLLCWQAAACLASSWSLWGADPLRLWLVPVFGQGMTAALASEAALAAVAFGPPTVVMGMLFSHLTAQARASGHSIGAALGFNTLGAAAAPLCFGLLLIPVLGPKGALLSIAAGYAVVGLMLKPTKPFSTKVPALVVAAALLVTVGVAPPLAFVDVPEGGRVVSYRDGTMAAVSVVEDAGRVSRLRINNRQQEGSSSSLLSDARQALLPLWLHPNPTRALFLGLGTGATVMSAAADAALQVDAVELLPEVIEASAYFSAGFAQALAQAGAEPALGPPANLNVVAADARRFIKTTSQVYDVIVSDNFHPARSGSGSLYTVEHFAAVRNRLTQQGVFCQWLPLHQLDIDTLRSIVRSFLVVFPDGTAMLATNSLETPVLGLIGRGAQQSDPQRFDLQAVRRRLAGATTPITDSATSPTAPSPLKFGVNDEWALLGNFIAGPDALKRFAGTAPLNTDDRPVVAYRAPRITYAPDSLPRERLSALLNAVSISPADLLPATADAKEQRRLAAYWAGRNRFIEIGVNVQASVDVRRMLLQVREPLLGVLRISPDFRPAYDPLLRMANVLRRSDPAAALGLLNELQRVQPAWQEAAELAAEITGSR